MTTHRLPPPFGAWIDRDSPVSFTFEGRRYPGFAGDTIASALAANDVRLLSRSFKYHRPRGVLTMSGDDANTLVQVGDRPNVPADIEPVRDGMAVEGQHYRGSLISDGDRWIEWLHRFLPVGFYYRAFFRPRGIWPWWERFFRRKAGLGRVSLDAPHGRFDKLHHFAETAVIGGGAAGLSAALADARDGGDVILIERQPHLGGALNHARFDATGRAGAERAAKMIAEIEAHGNIRIMTAATCCGYFADNYLSVLRQNRLHKLRADKVVLATGVLDQPLIFANNDMPGVMFGSAAQRLIRLYGVRPGNRAVVVCANEDGYGVALDLLDAGVAVTAIVDLTGSEGPLAAALAQREIEVLQGWTIREAVGTETGLHAAVAAPISRDGECGAQRRRLDCDLLCVCVGWTPAASLAAQAGATVAYDEAVNGFRISDCPAGLRLAGSVNGMWTLDNAIADGSGQAAQADIVNHPWPIFPHENGKDFVDFDEDLTVADIRNAVAEGFEDVELVKRFSTVGMGPSQGRQSAVNSVRLIKQAGGAPLHGARGTTNRPPAYPEPLGLLAGRPYHPVRLSVMHDRHLEAGAAMLVAGAWLRPAYYGASAEQAIAAEVNAVRRNVAVMDVSTLGGLEIRGPDAANFLERIYTMTYATLAVGRSRYVLMCNELGTVVDDGVACRMAPDHFYVTATTGNSDGVYREMLFRNAQWRLDVDVANVTGAMAAINIAGPRARHVLAPLCDDIDLSPDGFPYLAVRSGAVAGIPARLLRVGFVGELGYEIHVSASHGEALWDAISAAGAADGIRPFGVEAQRILRLEKGHIIIGQDSDALTHPHELAMGWAIGRRKPYFTGARGIEMRLSAGSKRCLAGFVLPADAGLLPRESQLVLHNGDIAGRVTSIARSPTLGRPIGLAFVPPALATPGTTLTIKGPRGRMIEAETVALPFYDPDNRRQDL